MMSANTVTFLHDLIAGINVFFVIYLIGYASSLFAACVFGSVKLFERYRMEEMKNKLPNEHFVPVSLLVPAHNEESAILGTVYSLLDLNYNIFEIIVIDDGSTDKTADVMVERFGMLPVRRPIRMQLPSRAATAVYEAKQGFVPITLITKENGGKADALNMGINAAKYPYILTIDADTMLDENALKNIMVPAMENDDVIAVGGIVRPANDLKIGKGKVVRPSMPKKLLACMQAFEYDRSFLSSRLLFDKMNAILIISGAFGLYRKREVIAVGGYQRETIGEDMELVVKLHAYSKMHGLNHRISYAPDAVCWTQVPNHIGDYVRQRRRWHIGLFQTLQSYRWLLRRRAIGGNLWISFAYYLIYELLSPIIEVIGVLTILLSLWLGLVNIPFMLLFMLVYVVFGWMLTLTAFFSRIHTQNTGITNGDIARSVLFCLLENTVLKCILTFARLTAFQGYRRRKLEWNKVTRQTVDVVN